MFAAASSPAVAAAAPPAAPKAAAPAAAKPPPPPGLLAHRPARVNAVDTNHDGMLDANEVSAAQQKEVQQARAAEQQRIDAEFTKLDTNHDGQLNKAEFMAAAPPVQARTTPQQIIGQIDSNKDGKVSLQEYEAGPMASFNKLDTNHDGTVSPQELQAARAARK
jgi:Ca2+-binding EF-hand superfamily protein